MIFPKPPYLAWRRRALSSALICLILAPRLLPWVHTLIANVKGKIYGISSWGEPKASASLSGGILLQF